MAKPKASSKKASSTKASSTKASSKKTSAAGGLRIRMYRVGFGDFFLVTVPSKAGEKHILIDCGVTSGATGKGDIASIKTAVRHMVETTGGKLALLIVTHRHADHIIGFSRCADEFAKLKGSVEAIWMPAWEQEYDGDKPAKTKKFQDDLEQLALGMGAALAGATDDDSLEILGIAANATGVTKEGPGGGTNKASLELLKTKLGVTPKYYAKGSTADLPQSLIDAGLSADILGPPPITELDFVSLMDVKRSTWQYLDRAGGGTGGTLEPFAPQFVVGPEAYPPSAFAEWAPPGKGTKPDPAARFPQQLQDAVKKSTPAAMLMAAKKLDDMLNNQSLVVLFTWNGKRLLFAGDAQAGNWMYWLYELDKPTRKLDGLTLAQASKDILGSLDFYKAGHHGSTNATPLPAEQAMGPAGGFVTMCSTQANTFGNVKNNAEVPRGPLMDALAKRSTLIRSDHYAAKLPNANVPAIKGAPTSPPTPKAGTITVGDFWVDYTL